MIRIIPNLLFLFGCLLCSLGNANGAIGSPVAYYKFEGNGHDSSGNGNDGTPQGGITYGSGVNGQAALFNGTDSYFITNYTPSQNLSGDFTISAWIKWNGLTGQLLQRIVAKWGEVYGGTYIGEQEYNFYIDDAWTGIRGEVQFDYLGAVNFASGYVPPNGDWVLLTVVKKAQSIEFYAKDNLIYSGTASGTYSGDTEPLIIGAGGGPSLPAYVFNGLIDELRIYDRALSQLEIQQLLDLATDPVPTAVQPFLSVPISGDNRIQEKFISAVVDHHVPTGYNCNSSNKCADDDGKLIVTAFDGSTGESQYGKNCAPAGYAQDSTGTAFTFDGAINYVGSCGGLDFSSGLAYLNYDGHSGTDFAYGAGRPILAAADGILEVPLIDNVNIGSGSQSPQQKFNALKILHSNGLETWYLHAKAGTECLAYGTCPNRPNPGQKIKVKAGQKIAEVGDTGVSGNHHLHFEVRVTATDQIVDPFGCTASVTALYPNGCIGFLWKSLDSSPSSDDDGDGVPNILDNCIGTPNASQDDGDHDGIGDACERPVELNGTVETSDGADICAMVLASGRHMFSCIPTGIFTLFDLAVDVGGAVKLQVYADGFQPYIAILIEPGTHSIFMTRSGDCPSYNTPYDAGFFPNSAGKRIHITGKVLLQNGQTPICAMVLANGQKMFSCDSTGSYALNIPLDTNGQYKLQVYADGFAPTIQTFDEFKTTIIVRMARAAECTEGTVMSTAFDYPVGKPDGSGYYNAQDYGEYNDVFKKYHLGEDWNGVGGGNTDEGDPVYAISNGKVSFSGWESDSWGNVITIHHTLPTNEYGKVVESMYAHLGTVLVKSEDSVTRGQKIGTIGRTGTSAYDVAHLHFELRSDESIGADHGYSLTSAPEGWLDPSDFIDSHR